VPDSIATHRIDHRAGANRDAMPVAACRLCPVRAAAAPEKVGNSSAAGGCERQPRRCAAAGGLPAWVGRAGGSGMIR